MKLLLFLCSMLISAASFSQVVIDMEKLKGNMKEKPESKFRPDSTYSSFYTRENSDTMWFASNSGVIRCQQTSYLIPYHNKCSYWFVGKPASGKAEIVQVDDSGIRKIYKGTFGNGHYLSGKTLQINSEDSILLSGQYENNWPIGVWLTFFPTGKIHTISEYYKGIDYAVQVWEYDEAGKLKEYINQCELIYQ